LNTKTEFSLRKPFIIASWSFFRLQKPTSAEDPVLSKMYFLYLQVISNLYKLYQNMDKEFLDAVMKALDIFEREIVSRSKPFFGGISHRICVSMVLFQ